MQCTNEREWNYTARRNELWVVVKQLKNEKQIKTGKVGALTKAKCNRKWQNHDVHEECDLNVRILKIVADENIRFVWRDEETVTFLKSTHATNIYSIFLSHFLHCFPQFLALLITSSHCALCLCFCLLAPDWRISDTNCLSWCTQLLIIAQQWCMKTDYFVFPFADFLEIQLWFAFHLDGNGFKDLSLEESPVLRWEKTCLLS